MNNLFFEIEEKLFEDEDIIFDEERIKDFIFDYVNEKIKGQKISKRRFYFEKIVFDFFEYMGLAVRRTKKTRDFGIDGFVKVKIGFLGNLDFGLQIKYKKIGSNDIDLFLKSLRNVELNLGVIVCKDVRRLDNYDLNSRLRNLLFSKGIEIKEKLIKDKVDINSVVILKFEEIVEIVSSEIRSFVKAVYKK